MRGRCLCAVFAFVLALAARLPALTAEGSLFIQAGPAAPLDALPAGSVPDWTGALMVSTRTSGSGPSAELAIEGLYVHDAAVRSDTLYVEEAWAAWKPFDGFSLRLGRQRVGFGCGFAWSVVDELDPQPMPFDPHYPRVGLDSLRLSVDLASVGAPVQVSVETFAPRAEGAGGLIIASGTSGGAAIPGPAGSVPQLDDWGAAAQLSAFLGGFELGAAGTVRDFGADPPVSVGGWATVDLGGFVFGAEGAWRPDGAQFLLNCNRRLGDFGAIAEARWVPDVDRVWLFGELSWSRGELSAALSALFAVREASGLVDLTLSWAASDALVLSLGGTLYEKPEELPEIGPLPWRYSLTIAAEYFF